jgi:hypothetical protein
VDKVHFVLEKKKEKILHFSFRRLTRLTHYSADDVDDDDNNSHHSAAVLLLQKGGISTLNDRTEGERERERELHLARLLLLLLFVKQEFRYL